MPDNNAFDAQSRLDTSAGVVTIHSLKRLDEKVEGDVFSLPFSIRVILESLVRNCERYEFLKWGQQAFDNFTVVPPATGIIHQVNLEYLARVVEVKDDVAFPDTLVGTDSHTTMINGLGVLGWGVGGIEAEAVTLGQPYYMLVPEVIGFELTGALQEGVTATDLVLTVTQMLRSHGVVGKFVEFYGEGLSKLSLPDRATIANMSPEFGATCTFFPVDTETIRYLRGTGRDEELVELVEAYSKEQGLWRTDETPEPRFSETLDLDLESVEASLAGPRRPQDRVALDDMQPSFRQALAEMVDPDHPLLGNAREDAYDRADAESFPASDITVTVDGEELSLGHGSAVIAAITSCTNTSNPSVMMGAGLLARKAVEKGLSVAPHVKTSLAPGSKVVTEYLQTSGLLDPLEKLKFDVVGYGCTTCIGNSGPLDEAISEAVSDNDLVVAAVLSGNRNFEGRINPDVRANYLASPPLVVAYALAGTVDVDLANDPLGYGEDGDSVTTDHISPAGAIPSKMPAGQYLISKGVHPRDFNSYGSRRGNHEVMVRGTFGNIRLRNQLVDKEGGYTVHLPDGEETTIYEASLKYDEENVPLVVLAGKEYGSGSSRDWAAKGSFLLGVRAVIAESFERIHRSNLIGMGVLPLQYAEGDSAESLGLTGHESFDISGLADLEPGKVLTVKATSDDGEVKEFEAKARVDSPVEVEYLRNGGILQTVLRQMLAE